ncbi:hypothetical protein Fmac_031886 [Flemingia macrophylla]|uniref:Uncharacterized protein n=1 Tax=Flemingia macrophylla TaxID=520843 RepID=A0ABD1L3D0_9FABA
MLLCLGSFNYGCVVLEQFFYLGMGENVCQEGCFPYKRDGLEGEGFLVESSENYVVQKNLVLLSQLEYVGDSHVWRMFLRVAKFNR